MTPNRDTALLHHKARVSAEFLLQDLSRRYEAGQTKFRFELFEGFRSPQRQIDVLAAGRSKARPWQSAHQYGLAIDVVPRAVRRDDGSVKEGWTWTEGTSWSLLHLVAREFGWRPSISWDKPHLEHPIWQEIKKFVV